MSFVLQSLEILETNQLYQLWADTKPTKVSSDDTQVSELLTLINKQTNDLTTEQSVWRKKEPKIYGNKFRYRRLKYNDDNKAEFRNRNQALKGT